MKLLLHHHIQYLNTILVPLDFDEFQFVFLFLPLVLGDDDEVGVGALEDLLDGVVENALHVDPPEGRYQVPLPGEAQQGGHVPDLHNASSRTCNMCNIRS